jgi:autotransporter-associated beta strand protein
VDVTGTFSFGAGNVTADSVRIGYSNAGAATGPGVTGVFNQNGGTATLTELTVGGDRVTGSGTTGLTGIYNLAGGLLKSGSITTGTGTDYTTRTFNWSGGTIQNLDASTDLTISSGIAFNLSNTGTFNADSGRAIAMSSAIGGSGALVKEGAGSVTLNATNTYTGATSITGGTLALSGSGSIANSSAITINSSTTLSVTGLTGNFTLGASQSLGGSGTLLATGKNVIANGTLSPGNSPGTLIQDGGNLQLGANGDLNWQVYDATAQQEPATTPSA